MSRNDAIARIVFAAPIIDQTTATQSVKLDKTVFDDPNGYTRMAVIPLSFQDLHPYVEKYDLDQKDVVVAFSYWGHIVDTTRGAKRSLSLNSGIAMSAQDAIIFCDAIKTKPELAYKLIRRAIMATQLRCPQENLLKSVLVHV